jgi:cyclopropane fatty-acyl-phospholipid synthase-like methyltransferase
MKNKILDKVNNYYTGKIQEHGATPRGVDWNGEESQFMRFQQLCEGIPRGEKNSVLDYGCGFGSLITFLEKQLSDFTYTGFDISTDMVKSGKEKFGTHNKTWITDSKQLLVHDYVVASGIFNVMVDTPLTDWEKYIFETLQNLNRLATKEFSFNMLTSYSDKEYMKEYLYYAIPESVFSYCKEHFSKKVILNHGYPLYEFTIRVIK